MAVVASDLPMATHQFVVRVYVMVKQWRVPIIIAVAGNALTAVMSVVLVVFQVAGYAHLFHFVLERVFRMAVVASQFGVLALKWKFGVARVIETRVVPVAGVVAVFALLAAAPAYLNANLQQLFCLPGKAPLSAVKSNLNRLAGEGA